MIIEKSIDNENFHDFLSDAIEAAFEVGAFQGLWVQKYSDDGLELWDASTTDSKAGLNLLTAFELAGVQQVYIDISETGDKDREAWLIEELERLIELRWNEKHTIEVETFQFADYHDMYGVNRLDFY